MPQFIITANDFTDTEALSRRLAARPAHLQRMKSEKEKGIFIIGGAKLNAQNNMFASVLIVDLPDENAVQKWIENDPYIIGKVWNDIEISAFKIADV